MSLSNTPTPYIGTEKRGIAEVIPLPGDLLRIKYIAEYFLEDVKQFSGTRSMLGYTGVYMGRSVSVMGTRVGCPSIGIYSYELIRFCGCKSLMRVGTVGVLAPDVHVRDMVLAMRTCTTNNFMRLLGLPGDCLPVCSYSLLERAVAAARERGLPFHVGNVFSSDIFYAPSKQVQRGMTWADVGILAAEIEAAALYTNAAAAGVSALAVLTISDSIVTGEATLTTERRTSFTQMMEVILSPVS